MEDFNPSQNANAVDLRQNPALAAHGPIPNPYPPPFQPPQPGWGAEGDGRGSGAGVGARGLPTPPAAPSPHWQQNWQQQQQQPNYPQGWEGPRSWSEGQGYENYGAPWPPQPQEREREERRKKRKKHKHKRSPSRRHKRRHDRDSWDGDSHDHHHHHDIHPDHSDLHHPNHNPPPPQYVPPMEDEPIDDDVWNALQMATLTPPGATAEDFGPGQKYQREVKRFIEVPYKQQVKVPVTAEEEVVTLETRKVPRKKVVEEQVLKTKRVPYTQKVPRMQTRMKEIWVKQLVPETFTVEETQHLFKDVQVTETVKKEVECIEEVEIPVKKIVQVPSYRVDTVTNRKIMEVSGVQEFDLVPREGSFHITSARQTECRDPLCPIEGPHREHPQSRVVGRESYRRFGTNMDNLPEDLDERTNIPTSRFSEPLI